MEKVATAKKTKGKDSLGDRMKAYEDCYRNYIPNRSYVAIRVDGKAFHTFTKKLNKPFDNDLINDMDETTRFMCENIQGAKLGYVQSDEISIILTNFETLDTQMWFEGNIQKMCSISASLATAKFNQLRLNRFIKDKAEKGNINITDMWLEDFNKQPLAQFDSRVFILPNRSEVMNYLLWRQNDAVRNSISMTAQALYSHKELHGKNSDQMQELAFQKGVNWNDLDGGKKRGRLMKRVFLADGKIIEDMGLEELIEKSKSESTIHEYYTETHLREKLSQEIISSGDFTIRTKWVAVDTPNRFTENGFSFLKSIIPLND